MSMETGRLSMTSDRLKKLRERVEEVNKPIPFLQVLSNGDWDSVFWESSLAHMSELDVAIYGTQCHVRTFEDKSQGFTRGAEVKTVDELNKMLEKRRWKDIKYFTNTAEARVWAEKQLGEGLLSKKKYESLVRSLDYIEK